MAQLAGMSTEAFEDLYFDVCTLDYRKLLPGMKALKTLMDRKPIAWKSKAPERICASASKESGRSSAEATETFPTAKSSPAQ